MAFTIIARGAITPDGRRLSAILAGTRLCWGNIIIMAESAELLDIRMGPLLPPSTEAEIEVGFWPRLRLLKSFQHRINHAQVLYRSWSWGLQFVIFVISTIIIFCCANDFFNNPPVWMYDSIVWLQILLGSWGSWFASWGLKIIFGFVVYSIFFGAWRLLRFARTFRNEDTKSNKQKFEGDLAVTWSAASKDVIAQCEKDITEKICLFRDDKIVPYRILKEFLPVPRFSFRRPEKFVTGKLKGGAEKRNKRIFVLDCFAGGVLSLLGSKPISRFRTNQQNTKEPMVSDLYWRNDVQEVPDADQADIFLRFHQSMIEEDIDHTCYYKAFAALNNYRRTPILLLRVKDIVDCLANPKSDYDKSDREKIYKNLAGVDQLNILGLLSESTYQRWPPRIEAAGKDNSAPTPKVGPILSLGKKNDWVMQFDPARVWVERTNDQMIYINAIIALRNAIFLVSRTKTTEIILKKRDLLIVDNRRTLIARQEDLPSYTWSDRWASQYRSLEGRWLRKIYGTHAEGEDGYNNFELETDLAKVETAQGPSNTIQHSDVSIPSTLADSPSNEILFDYGANPKNWPENVSVNGNSPNPLA